MTDVQEQISKLAESTFASPSLWRYSCPSRSLARIAYADASPPVASKRTFSTLVSKVKAKVQEFDQTRYA